MWSDCCMSPLKLLVTPEIIMPRTLFTLMYFHVAYLHTLNPPERKFVPSVPASSVPSVSETPSSVEMRLSQQHSPHLSPSRHTPALSSNPSQQSLCHFATTSGVKGVSDLCHRGKLHPFLFKIKDVFVKKQNKH